MDNPLIVDVPAVRKEALQRALAGLERAETTEAKHYARLALRKAQRELGER